MVENKHRKNQSILVNFECETLKAEDAAEEHIRKYMPNLSGLDAVGMFIMFVCLSFFSFWSKGDWRCLKTLHFGQQTNKDFKSYISMFLHDLVSSSGGN